MNLPRGLKGSFASTYLIADFTKQGVASPPSLDHLHIPLTQFNSLINKMQNAYFTELTDQSPRPWPKSLVMSELIYSSKT